MAVKYLDMDTVEMTPEFWDYLEALTDEYKEDFWKGTGLVTLRKLDSKTMRFVNLPDNEIGSYTIIWERKGNQATLFEDLPPVPEVTQLSKRVAGIRITSDIDLTGDCVAIVGGRKHVSFIDVKGNSIRTPFDFLLWDAVRKNEDTMTKLSDEFMGFVMVNCLIDRSKDVFVVEEKVVRSKSAEKHTKSRKKKDYVATTRTYRSYRLKREFNFSVRNPIERTCRLWLVRGHDRYYKDGRVVHVSSYYKGVDRDTMQDEEAPAFGRKIKVKPDGLI